MKIVIVDENPIQREGMRLLLESHHFIVITARDIDEIPKDTQLLLYLADKPFELERKTIKQFKDHCKSSRLMVMDRRANVQRAILFFREGIKGYLAASFSIDDLPFVIRNISEERIFIDPAITVDLFNRMAGYENYFNLFQSKAALTTQEKQVLDLLVNGYTSREIAQQISTTKRVIDDLTTTIVRKTGATDNLSLVFFSLYSRYIANSTIDKNETNEESRQL